MPKITAWLANPYFRIFNDTAAVESKKLKLEGALNETFSFQCGVAADEDRPFKISAEAEGPEGWFVQVRSVGYVPVRHRNTSMPLEPEHNEGLGHIPGYVPDPLFEHKKGDVIASPLNETNAFWFTVSPSKTAKSGTYKINVIIKPGLEKDQHIKPVKLSAEIKLHNLNLPTRKDFRVTHWFYVDALFDWYKFDGFKDEKFWIMLEKYFLNIASHGQDTIFVPAFTPPLDGIKRPSQLIKVKKLANGKLALDWSDVEKYIKLAKKCGFTHFEWSHIATQWGAKYAIRIYEGQGEGEKLIFKPELPATDPSYKNFLIQYLGELKNFLSKEKILNKSYFHLSDEPMSEEALGNYRKGRAMLHEIAPWVKVMDALSHITFAREKLTDIPIPVINEALKFIDEKIPNTWCYYCCCPKGKFLNHLMDTPLTKVAMHGLLFYRWPFEGFLHWGYNYWYKSQTRKLIDPFTVQDGDAFWGSWGYGDTFLVYPGENGPIDSIRWELFAEAMNDYRLLQAAGIDRDDKLLKEIKSFSDFPLNPEWRLKLRSKLLRMATKNK